jgi:predicted nuclease with TOPRIM domain
MKIEVSNGEIADKLTIIELKLERISDPDKLKNLRKEHTILEEALAGFMKKSDPLYGELYEVNAGLWDIEDRIRDLERKKEFGKEFIDTARSVYFMNDRRSDIKRKINIVTGSGLVEEKSYEKY